MRFLPTLKAPMPITFLLWLWTKQALCVDVPHQNKLEHKLVQTSSGLWLAYNRGYNATWEDAMANLVGWVNADPSRRAEPFREAAQTTAFSYIDSYGGQRLVNDKAIGRVIQVVDRKFTNGLCDKYTFQLAAKVGGLEGIIVPRAYFSKEDALNVFSSDGTEIVFIKDRTGTFGSGIQVASVKDLPTIDVPPDSIIQEGLTKDLALFDGAKVTIRAYFLIMHGRVFCHDSGWVQVQNEYFQPLNTSKEVQVSHERYTIFDLDMRFEDRDAPTGPHAFKPKREFGEIFPLTSISNGTRWMSSFAELGRRAGPMLEQVARETSHDPTRFSYLGVDLIPFEDGSLQMLEANSYPSFRRSDVMTDIILRAFHMEKYDADLKKRLVEVWKFEESHDEL